MYGKDRNGVGRTPLMDTEGVLLTKPGGGGLADAALNGRLFCAAMQTATTGGRVLMKAIIGEVTTAPDGANAMKLIANATVATAADTDLCVAVDLDTCDVGDLISITGTPGDNILAAHKCSVQVMGPTGVVLPVGTLQLHCAGSTTGAIKWQIWYIPLDTGAYVTVV